MKKIIAVVLLLASGLAWSQSVNDYKYVLLPSKFSFLKSPDAYGLNTLTKSMLEKYGFVVFMDNDVLPEEIRNYNCNKLYADVVDNTGLFQTRLSIVLKDCNNRILFATEEGTSKEKDWKLGYNQALRATAKSFDKLRYKYNGKVTDVPQAVEKVAQSNPVAPAPVVAATAVTGTPTSAPTSSKEVLYAMPIPNGYQLVDSKPQTVMVIYGTGSQELYMAEKGTTKGVLRNGNGQWFFEYYVEGKLISEPVNIKF